MNRKCYISPAFEFLKIVFVQDSLSVSNPENTNPSDGSGTVVEPTTSSGGNIGGDW